MKRFDRVGAASLLPTVAVVFAVCCARAAFLDDDALEKTFSFLDDPATTRAALVRRFGRSSVQGEAWIRYETATMPPLAVRRKTLVVLFDEQGRVADYRYTAVKGCTMPRVLGELPAEKSLAEICRPGKTKAEVLARLGPPAAAGPKMLAYLELKGRELRGRIISFDDDGRYLRLTRTALNVAGDDLGAGPELGEETLSKLREGMLQREVREILGPPQMACGDVWGYCSTSSARKKLLVVKFHPRRGVCGRKVREAFDARAGHTSKCYVCHRLSFAPTCLDCHEFGRLGR